MWIYFLYLLLFALSYFLIDSFFVQYSTILSVVISLSNSARAKNDFVNLYLVVYLHTFSIMKNS